MKKIFSLMVVVLAAATVFTSCKKDDEGSYPAKLDGLYAAMAISNSSDTTYVSLWIEGTYAEILEYYEHYTSIDTIIIGTLTSYDANNGKGTISGTGEANTASIQAQKGSSNIIVTIDGKSVELRYLTPVGFSKNTWYGDGTTEIGTWDCALTVGNNDSTCTISWAIEGFATVTDNYKIAKIYGFWNVGDGMSVGTFQFVDSDNDTTYWLGFRMDEGSSSFLTIMNEDGEQYPLSNAVKTQVTSALAE